MNSVATTKGQTMAKKKYYASEGRVGVDERKRDKAMRSMGEYEASSSREDERRMKYVNQGEYAGYDARRALEYRDGSMISEDHNAIANLPQQVIMRYWPAPDYEQMPGLNDTIAGIDHQIKKDTSKHKRESYPDMY
jgi:hypothetical protein